MFKKIKYFYDMGIWSLDMVRNEAYKGKITPEEFEQITGQKYE